MPSFVPYDTDSSCFVPKVGPVEFVLERRKLDLCSHPFRRFASADSILVPVREVLLQSVLFDIFGYRGGGGGAVVVDPEPHWFFSQCP